MFFESEFDPFPRQRTGRCRTRPTQGSQLAGLANTPSLACLVCKNPYIRVDLERDNGFQWVARGNGVAVQVQSIRLLVPGGVGLFAICRTWDFSLAGEVLRAGPIDDRLRPVFHRTMGVDQHEYPAVPRPVDRGGPQVDRLETNPECQQPNDLYLCGQFAAESMTTRYRPPLSWNEIPCARFGWFWGSALRRRSAARMWWCLSKRRQIQLTF